ncbi:MAG: glycosyl transferase, group 1 [Acidimicrobiales bacterium]|nr:glycosyl transferase, group 1 [Acidimicrobiales bacterium]
MPRTLRLAVLKPEFGVRGGLESVVDRIEGLLRADGHDVTHLAVDMVPPRREVVDLQIPQEVWDAAPEYFPYLRGRDAFDQLDTRRFDAIVSTQAPSFSHRHPRHLSVFYHHHRVYYDLEETYLAAGFAPDPEVHRAAGKLIRELDQPRLEQVGWFLAGSAAVADRLARFNGRTDTSVFHAGHVIGDGDPGPTGPPGGGSVLSVGRHEFPKRTELVVAAAHLLPHQPFALVGTGGRESWARSLDHRLATTGTDPAALTDAETWCNTGRDATEVPAGFATNVSFDGRVSDEQLARRYHEAPCVVAPAFQEDYGLTAIEAMAQGRPVVVCHDGGGLTELVEHGRTGLVVDPTPAAIATAIEKLTTDPDLAAELGANGRRRAAELSWEAAAVELRAGLDRVLA